LNGDKWYEAHCSHAYQHAARKWGHRRVTLSVIGINLCWLFPIAYLVYLNENIAGLLALVAYVPLIILALKFQAGLTAISNTNNDQ
jgi:Fuc2NAc and GlcNAc transferase